MLRRVSRLSVACGLMLVAWGCGKSTPSETENVFGPDNRETPADAAPYKAVGRLDSGCTGTIIGKRLVLTAAHCIFDSTTGTVKPEVRYFHPNLRRGRSPNPTWIEFAWLGTNQPEDRRASDWAVLRLADDVSATYGKIAVHPTDFYTATLPYTVSLIGYSADKESGDNVSLHRGCYVHKVTEGKLFHDCDAASGASGGPLIETINGNPYIVGITVSEYRQGAPGSVTRDQYSEDYTNVAVPASTFTKTTTEIIKNLEAGTAVPSFDGIVEVVNPNNRGEPVDPVDPVDPDDQNEPSPNSPFVDAGLLLRREGLVKETIEQLNQVAADIQSIGYRAGAIELLEGGEDLEGAIRAFNLAMADFVRSRGGSGPFGAVQDAHDVLMKKIEMLTEFDSAGLPARAVSDWQRALADVQGKTERLNGLILN